MERTNVVTDKGNPLTLVGPELKVGDKAPDFTLLDTKLNPVKLSDSKGKVRLMSMSPSIDTKICDMQTVAFNKRAANLSDDVVVYTITADLPYAQARYAAAKHLDRVQMLSDYKEVKFAKDYGVLIKEDRLLTRAVIIVDRDDRVRYIQICKDTSKEPNYDEAMGALQDVLEMAPKR